MRLKLLLKTTALTLLLIIAGKVGWSAVITSNAVTGNWNATSTWVGAVVPGASDDVIIADGAVVTINATPVTVASLTVGQGASGILTFDVTTGRALTVTGDITIATGGRFSMLPAIYVTGDVTSGSPTVTNINTAGMAATNVITSVTGLTGGSATVSAVIDAASLTLSANASATATGVLFAVYPTPVAQTNTIAIGGNITNNGIFDLSMGGATAVCNATFNKVATSDQAISGTGSLTRFRGITLNRANIADKVLATVNVYMNGSGLFVFTKGTWEQSAGVLTIAGGNQTIGASGSLVFSGSGGLSQPASSIVVTGNLTVNTSGTFNLGVGNNSITTTGTPTLNFLAGNVYIYGRLTLTLGTTTINGADIYIDPQSSSNLGVTSNTFEISGAPTVNFSSGSVTIVDPNAALTTGNDLKFALSTGSFNMTGGTIYIGDGVSTSVSTSTQKYAGFNLSTGGLTIKNLVLRTGGIVGRNVQLKGSLVVSNILTLTSGTLDIFTQSLTLNNPIAGTTTNLIDHYIGTGGTLNIAGTASNMIIPSSLDSLVNLTINNANGATMQGDLVVKTLLTLTSGKLDLGSGNLKISSTGSITGASSSNYIVTSGAGTLKMNTIAAGIATYPLGSSATSYTPFISTNNTSADVLGVRINNTFTHAPLDAEKCVKLEWIINEGVAGGNDGTIAFSWNVADQGTNFDPTKPVYLGTWNGASYDNTLVTVTGTGPYTATVNSPATFSSSPYILYNVQSTETDILTFDFNGLTPAVIGSVNATLHTVALTVPFGTNVTALVPTITLSAGATVSPLTGVAQDFTTAKTYTVTAEDGTTTQDWTVTVTVASATDTDIETFDFNGLTPAVIGTVDATAHTVALTVPYGTNVTALVPTITLSAGATVSPLSAVAGDFTAAKTYTVTAQDGTTTQDWTVTVTIAPASTATDILTFDFNGLTPAVVGTVNATLHTVALTVPYGTNVTALVPTITLSAEATVSPLTAVAGDFTAAKTYTVTAQDGTTTQDWTVIVTIAPNTATDILTFDFNGLTPAVVGTVSATDHTVALTVPNSTDVTTLVPTITLSTGATVSPLSAVAGDFTAAKTYTVTAQDGTTTQAWIVTVTKSAPIVTIHDIQYTTNASGDSPYATQAVTTSGIVTAIKYNSSSVQQGFYIQNGTGAWNGVYVYSTTPIVAIGDNVTITGTVTEYNKMTEFTPVTNATIVSSGNTLPSPVELTTLAANDESYESVLVSVKAATCSSDSGSGTAVVNDGSGVLTVYKNLFPTFALTVGSKYDIIGIIADYYTTSHLYELYPRGSSDITNVTGIDENSNSNLSVYPNPFTNEIRFTGTQDVKRVTVSNIIGQVLKNVAIDQVNSVSTQDLPRGIYLVTLMNGKGEKTTIKMIKQ